MIHIISLVFTNNEWCSPSPHFKNPHRVSSHCKHEIKTRIFTVFVSEFWAQFKHRKNNWYKSQFSDYNGIYLLLKSSLVMLSPAVLSWCVVAKSYKHISTFRDISWYLFRVSWFLDVVVGNKRAPHFAKLITTIPSYNEEPEEKLKGLTCN